MKLFVALAALLAAAPATPQVATGPGTPYFAGMPPARFQADNAQVVVFTSNLEQFCGPAPEGLMIVGCARQIGDAPVLFLPNPCGSAGREYFARIACHELGHRNGWDASHND